MTLLPDRERLRLHHAPYTAPSVSPGDTLFCEYRQEEQVVGGYTDALIPWPRVKKTGRHSPIVTSELARAVRLESELAVSHHWGVSVTLVWYWRKALGVGRVTDGTRDLYEAYGPTKLTEEVSARGRERAREADALERMASSKRGRPAHPKTAAALRKAASRPKGDEHRAKLRAVLGVDEWSADELVDLARGFARGLSDREIARELGRTPLAIKRQRLLCGLLRRRRKGRRPLADKELDLIKASDGRIAAKDLAIVLNRHPSAISRYRRQLGLDLHPLHQPRIITTPEETTIIQPLSGSYRPPAVATGDRIFCAYRGRKCRVVGWSDAPISWPVTPTPKRPSPIVCGDLLLALREESRKAVASNWGVSLSSVQNWSVAIM